MEQVEQVFGNPHFKIVRQLLCFSGLWPYASVFDKYVRRFIIWFFIVMAFIPTIFAVKHYCGERNRRFCTENIVSIFYFGGVCTKYTITILYESKMIILYQRVACNWLNLTVPAERAIMKKYIKKSRLISIYYIVYMIFASFAYCGMNLINPFFDLVIPLNYSRRKELILNAVFPVDIQEYYYHIIVMQTMIILTSSSAFVPIDVIYNTNVHQSLGILTVISYRLQKAVDQLENEDESYATIISAIKLHKTTIELIEIIDSTYQICNLVLVGSSVLVCSIGIVTLLDSMYDKFIVTKMILLAFGIFLHMLFYNYQGQIVINHCNDLFVNTYLINWYNFSEKSKKLLKIMMLHCFKPRVVTAGGLYVFSYENFSVVFRTSVSYIMVAVSLK